MCGVDAEWWWIAIGWGFVAALVVHLVVSWAFPSGVSDGSRS